MDDLDTDLTDRVSISAVPQPQILLPSIIEL
jgi:hypothetical protein